MHRLTITWPSTAPVSRSSPLSRTHSSIISAAAARGTLSQERQEEKDLARTKPWQEDIIVIMGSLDRSMSALCMHIFFDHRKFDFDAPVANYWPEFAQAGKQGILIRHILSHTCSVIYCDCANPGSWFRWEEHINALE